MPTVFLPGDCCCGGSVFPCCNKPPDLVLPDVLTAMFSGKTGGAVCMPDSVTLLRDPNFPTMDAWYCPDVICGTPRTIPQVAPGSPPANCLSGWFACTGTGTPTFPSMFEYDFVRDLLMDCGTESWPHGGTFNNRSCDIVSWQPFHWRAFNVIVPPLMFGNPGEPGTCNIDVFE